MQDKVNNFFTLSDFVVLLCLLLYSHTLLLLFLLCCFIFLRLLLFLLVVMLFYFQGREEQVFDLWGVFHNPLYGHLLAIPKTIPWTIHNYLLSNSSYLVHFLITFFYINFSYNYLIS